MKNNKHKNIKYTFIPHLEIFFIASSNFNYKKIENALINKLKRTLRSNKLFIKTKATMEYIESDVYNEPTNKNDQKPMII